MSELNWLLVAGWAASLVISVGVAVVMAHRRFVRLERRAQQAERLAELGTLTGGLAHEIKNPLSTVQLNLQLLREDLDPHNPAYGRVINRLATVQRETGRLKDILDDFLRYAGKIELERRPVELNRLLEELVDFFTPQAQLQRVQLRLKKSPDEVVVKADPRLLKQAVLNLMLNAVQAMGEKGGELILSAGRMDGQACIDVIDTGGGISPEVRDRIFDAYYSTKKGGTGLGLAMTRRIIQEHGGRVTLRSEMGKGTDFTLHLPVG
jgi:signal transduction histidine kinase